MYTKETIREPKNVILIYRNLQLLFWDFNNICRQYLLMFVNNVTVSFVVWCNFVLIKLHDRATIEVLGTAVVVSATSAGFLIITYMVLGDINQKSIVLISSWKLGRETKKLSPADKKLMKKYIKSCRFLGVELGSFGCYKKPTSIRIIGKLVTYTVKFLMMMSNLM